MSGYGTNVGLPSNGYLDEFRLYSRALTAAEVAQLYNPFAVSGFLGADQNLCPGTPVAISQPWPVSSTAWSNGSANDTLVTDSAGTYILNLTGACGTGSDTITLNSLVTTAGLTESACEQYIAPGGGIHTVSGVFTDTILNAAGCDSVITIDLTIKNNTSSASAVQACQSYTSPGGNYVWTASGTYTDTIPNMAGCDSIITIDLSIEIPSAGADLQGTTFTASPAGATYQWINCSTGQPVAGATGDTFTPTASGSYAVVVNSVCTDTSTCQSVTISGAGLSENDLTPTFTLYPNPGNGKFVVQTSAPQAWLTVHVVNNLGQVLLSKRVQNSAQTALELEAEAGIYYVILTLDSGQKITKTLLKN